MILKIIIDTLHDVRSIPQYKYYDFLDQVNKFHHLNLFLMMSYNKCTVCKYIYAQWTYRKLVSNQKNQIPLKNDKDSKDIMQLCNIINIPYVMFNQ